MSEHRCQIQVSLTCIDGRGYVLGSTEETPAVQPISEAFQKMLVSIPQTWPDKVWKDVSCSRQDGRGVYHGDAVVTEHFRKALGIEG